jgi:phage gp29-like protein
MPNPLSRILRRGLQVFSRQVPPPTTSQSKEPASPIAPEIDTIRPRTIRPTYDSAVYTWTDWDTVGQVKSALTQLEAGIFISGAQLVDAMGRDDRISAVLETRVRGLLGLDMKWGDDEDVDAELDQHAKALQEAFPAMLPDDAQAELLSWGIMLGVGVGECIWYDRAGKYTPVPRLKVWHPQFLTWRWDTRSFWLSTQTGNVEVTPGDGHWVLYAPYGVQRGWMHGLVRSLAVPWLLRQYAMRDSARYGEAYGQPVKQAIVPSNGSKPDKDTFLLQVAALAAESTLLTPQSVGPGGEESKFDFKLHELQGKGHEVFEAQLRRADTNIAVKILGQNLTTEAGTGTKGSLATAKVHDRVRQDVLEFDDKTLSHCLRDQVVRPWAAANYGDPELAPVFRRHTEPPEDKSQDSATALSLSQAVNTFKMAQAPVDARKLLENFDLPLLTEEQEQQLKAEAAAKEEADRAAQVDQAKAIAAAKGGGKDALSRIELAGVSKAVLEGQSYVDAVADAAKVHATRLMRPEVKAVLAAVDGAEDYATVRMKLLQIFGEMEPAKLAKLTEKALILSRLAGMHAVLEDL